MSKLIVLEGLDGAGTTTQSRRLAEHLGSRNIPTHLTREPSDGPIGQLLRQMLVGQHALPTGSINQSTFGLLFAADRLDHLQREVEPQLSRGIVVVSDRWYHSSLAYQGTDADRSWITQLNQRARTPDLTIFLKVRPEVAAQRRVDAGRAHELFDDLKMQEAVAAGYATTIAELTARGEQIEVIDGELSLNVVFQQILQSVEPLLTWRP